MIGGPGGPATRDWWQRPSLVVIQLNMIEKLGNGSGHLGRRVPVVVVLRGEGETSMAQHVASEVVGRSGGLYPKVAEHGVRLPSAQEHDVVGANVGAEEGSGPTRAQGAARETGGLNASGGRSAGGSPAQGVGYLGWGNVNVTRFGMGSEEPVQRGCRRRLSAAEMVDKPAKRLGGAEKGVIGRAMPHLFAPDGILLVIELENSIGDAFNVAQVINRSVRAVVDFSIHVEENVAETEGLRAAFGLTIGVFGRPKEEEESKHNQAHEVLVRLEVGLVDAGRSGLESRQLFEDGGVDRVGPGSRVVVPAEAS